MDRNQNKAEIKQVLTEKSNRIELLETEFQNLKSIVIELTTERKSTKNDGFITNDPQRGKDVLFRTCHEAHTNNPTLPSGMRWIDPDGQEIGDYPILVYCDMTSGNYFVTQI